MRAYQKLRPAVGPNLTVLWLCSLDGDSEWMLMEALEIDWIESDEPLTHLGHGVEFHHDDLSRDQAVGFIDGFEGWYRSGGRAKVRILRTCPNPSIGLDRWAEITRSIRDAVFAILVDKAKMKTFRHNPSDPVGTYGPIYILVNS